ncbi:Histidine kinase [Zhouia amylolytica]|uniref:Histidine kinase n=1 Tax=Zhouia amylolytica TaxID=376730 RepID=A0A1I6PU57_9FLAO|nr:histidine kinase [Zhouia amylolytica]SFS43751.1 Histidine kinase [Zhouia amylolytica]
MKRAITLVLFLILILFFPGLDSHRSPNVSKKENNTDPNWEYVKERLFAGDHFYVNKYHTPILFEMFRATKEDSLAVSKVIKEIQGLLPNKKVGFFDDYMGMSSAEIRAVGKYDQEKDDYNYLDLATAAIKLKFNCYALDRINERHSQSPLKDGNQILRTYKEVGYTRYFSSNTVCFSFSESISRQQRQSYIRYEMLRSLCDIRKGHHVNKKTKYSVYESAAYTPDQYEFTSQDKFLLQKLYAPDFIDQFKSYLHDYYGFGYTLNFTNPIAITSIVFTILAILFLGVVALGGPFILGTKFQNQYLNYCFTAFVILMTVFGFNNLHSHLLYPNQIIFSGWQGGFAYLILAVLSALIISFLLWISEKYLIKERYSFIYKLLLKAGLLYLSIIIPINIYYLIIEWNTPDGVISSGNFSAVNALAFILALGRGVLIYLKRFSDNIIKEKDLELSQLKELQTQTALKSLQAHINPHFLYNSLNSIAELVHTDRDKTEQMALSLSDLFRYSINRSSKKSSTLKEEVEMVKNYLEIEKIRFGDQLDYNIEVEHDLENVEIPMFLIQPLIENAVKHGISKTEEKGIIKLKIEKQQHDLHITVYDNGPSFPEGLVSGYGLQMIQDVLSLTYGDQATLSWQNRPEKMIEIVIQKHL